VTRAALALAAARAGHAGPVHPQVIAETVGIARRCCRRVVELPGRRLVVAWADGYGPNLDEDTLIVARLSRTRLVALGVCLGLCWDPNGRRFPGRTVSEDAFDAELDALGVPLIHVKSALPGLHEIGLISFIEGTITLGPALAQWSEATWNELHVLYPQLPGTDR
jgi:hypothetical protein